MSKSFSLVGVALLIVVGGCDHGTHAGKSQSDAADVSQGKTDGQTDVQADSNIGEKADSAAVADVTIFPDAPPIKLDVVSAADRADIVASSPDATSTTPDLSIPAADSGSPAVDSAGADKNLIPVDAAVDTDEEVDAPPDIPITVSPGDAAEAAPNKPDVTVKKDTAPAIVDATVVDSAADDALPSPFQLAVAPNRMLDLIFMIDNSPSMALKQDKLKAQFPKLIDGLKDPSDGTLPDLRVALLNSDLGSGGAYTGGACGPKTLPDSTSSIYGDLGRFQMIGAQACGVTDTTARWLEHSKGQAVNYTGDIGTVFSCLASNLGTMGCGLEHTLQAFEFALVANGIGNTEQRQMLRPSAYLGLVMLSDEDDCSAATNDGLFGDKAELRGEAHSLRCGTRAHACGGVNLTGTPPGFPTTTSFSAPFATCAPRTDACPDPTDTSVPTSCSPLRSVQTLATEIKSLKSKPDEQIFVAGIFGWPLSDADMATATYKIAPIPNPNTADTAHPTVYDTWPVCYDPNHPPTNPDPTTGYDPVAAYWGAMGGLRLGSFVDEFGDNGLKFSICQPDFSAAMSKIGSALSKKMQNLCLPAIYAQLTTCTANYLIPDTGGTLVRQPTPVPKCNAQQSNAPCYALTSNATTCPGAAYLVQLSQGIDAGVSSLPYGTMLEFRCQ